MNQAEWGVGHAHRKLSFKYKLIDALHVFLSALHHEGWNPQDTVVQHGETLHKTLPHRLVPQTAVHPLDHRRVHGGEVRLEAHVLRKLHQGGQVTSEPDP